MYLTEVPRVFMFLVHQVWITWCHKYFSHHVFCKVSRSISPYCTVSKNRRFHMDVSQFHVIRIYLHLSFLRYFKSCKMVPTELCYFLSSHPHFPQGAKFYYNTSHQNPTLKTRHHWISQWCWWPLSCSFLITLVNRVSWAVWRGSRVRLLGFHASWLNLF
jgi:hypothetical protein